MGGRGKRKIDEGREVAPCRQSKRKVADTQKPDHDRCTETVVTTGTGRSPSPVNSDLDEPQVEGYVKVELDPYSEVEVDPGIDDNNGSQQQLFEEHSFSAPVLADPDMDIGDIDVKVFHYPEEEQLLQEEDEGEEVEVEVSRNPEVGDLHPIISIASTSKLSEREVRTSERGNDTGSNDSSANVQEDPLLNEQVEMTGSNPEVGGPLINQNLEVAASPCQLLTTDQGQLDPASSLPNSILPQMDTRGLEVKDASEGSSTCCETFAETSELKLKMGAMQKEIEMLHQEVTHLREDNKELAWFKNKYLKDPEWETELHAAVFDGTEEEVQKLVEDGAYVNSRNKDLCTPIIGAVDREDKAVCLRIIKFLIENGADPFAKDSCNDTFLHILIGVYSLTPTQFHDIATYLVSKNLGKLFNTQGPNGICSLQIAIKKIEVEGQTLSVLHKGGVNFKVLDSFGHNLLGFALDGNRSSRLMDDLILIGVDWRHLNEEKRNLLHLASQAGLVNGVKYFLALGIDVNSIDIYGETPLHRVISFAEENVLETARVLIENGADVQIQDFDGGTALDAALERKGMPDKDQVIQLLEEKESDLRE